MKTENWKDDFKTFAVRIRLFFSLAIGFTVSHPLVLFVFDETIQKYIVIYNEQEKVAMTKSEIDENRVNETPKKKLEDSLRIISLTIDLLTEARNNEGNSSKSVTIKLPDGRIFKTSGKVNKDRPGPESKVFDDALEDKKKDKNRVDDEIKRINGIIDKNKSNSDYKKAILDSVQKADYLTRSTTLSKIEDEPKIGFTVFWIKWFLISFFVFVDIIPLFFKVITKYGEYDQKLNEANMLNKIASKFKFEIDRETELLKRYLAKYIYEMNRDLGRIGLEHIFRYKNNKIHDSVSKTFNSANELKDYLKKDTEM